MRARARRRINLEDIGRPSRHARVSPGGPCNVFCWRYGIRGSIAALVRPWGHGLTASAVADLSGGPWEWNLKGGLVARRMRTLPISRSLMPA